MKLSEGCRSSNRAVDRQYLLEGVERWKVLLALFCVTRSKAWDSKHLNVWTYMRSTLELFSLHYTIHAPISPSVNQTLGHTVLTTLMRRIIPCTLAGCVQPAIAPQHCSILRGQYDPAKPLFRDGAMPAIAIRPAAPLPASYWCAEASRNGGEMASEAYTEFLVGLYKKRIYKHQGAPSPFRSVTSCLCRPHRSQKVVPNVGD